MGNSIEPGVPGGDKIINNVVDIAQNHDFDQIYTKQEDIIYKATKYSNDVNPNDYIGNYWKQINVDQQKGSPATIFFRRAFDERQNRNIKFYSKCVVVSILSAFVVWKYDLMSYQMFL